MTLGDRVSQLMREVAGHVIMPRFRMLAPGETIEKSPGEVVTIADREAEERLHDGLSALGLGARIVGEEAAAHTPALLDHIGEGPLWLIDPLDGTANFAAGRAPFGMMIALVEDGMPVGAWILDPLSGRLHHAERGKGATCDGTAIPPRVSRRSPIRAAIGSHFMTEGQRMQLHHVASRHLDVRPVPRCAAESYARLLSGQDDAALFQRILPWDHAAGALLITESGGVVTHWDGSPYRIGGPGRGILAASNAALWQEAAARLFVPEAGLAEAEARF
ncbi:MAG: inositol monophosphatase family protein [Sphingopyxis sp.]|uniref:inositol monophosphatase family protein n=1 Tax=Sphingopyxis sp. TaxID=1908224 RepID=UPI002ABC5C4D|nr:inositol monophosphatase family protein [Sphingopyxis sp.]MDZ3833300.1 inositol monophosphatase family protein [Sphingopyxis sp.]